MDSWEHHRDIIENLYDDNIITGQYQSWKVMGSEQKKTY